MIHISTPLILTKRGISFVLRNGNRISSESAEKLYFWYTLKGLWEQISRSGEMKCPNINICHDNVNTCKTTPWKRDSLNYCQYTLLYKMIGLEGKDLVNE